MKAKDLRERSVDDLKELEKSLRVDTFQNRLRNFTNRLDDTSVMNKTKRELARVITLLSEKTRAATPSGQGADVIPAPKPTKKVATPKKTAAPKASVKSVEGAEAKAPKAAKKKTAKKDEAK
jgi:large subunit ribosomal protein L29